MRRSLGQSESTASGRALRRRRSRQRYWVETADACCCYGGESAPPTHENMSSDTEKSMWRKYSQICAVYSQMDTELHRSFSLFKIKALCREGCRVQTVGSFRSFSAQPDPDTEISYRTPWQCCRTFGLDLPTFSTITTVHGSEVGHQPTGGEACLWYHTILVQRGLCRGEMTPVCGSSHVRNGRVCIEANRGRNSDCTTKG